MRGREREREGRHHCSPHSRCWPSPRLLPPRSPTRTRRGVLARHRRIMAAGLATATHASPACCRRSRRLDFASTLAGSTNRRTATTASSSHRGCSVSARRRPAPAISTSTPHAVRHTPGGQRTTDAVGGRATDPGAPALIWLADAAALAPSRHAHARRRGPLPRRRPLGDGRAPGDPTALDAWVQRKGRIGVGPARRTHRRRGTSTGGSGWA